MMVDVFPNTASDKPLKQLRNYPEKNFAYWRYKTLPTGEQKQCFLCFINAQDLVCYMKKPSSEKSDATILQIGKGCKSFTKSLFCPRKVNFGAIKSRLKKDITEENRMNADTRLSFKLGNEYLVKTYFTSGLRTVQKGTAHVIQTLKVPVLLYLYSKKCGSDSERAFPYEKFHLLDLSILPPMTANRIPPGTKYVLLTVQKTFFTFDVVPENYVVPFKFRDPVKHRVTKLPGCGDFYLEKPKTPYIENVSLEQQQVESPEQQMEFSQQSPEQQQIEFPQQFPEQQQIEFPEQQQIASTEQQLMVYLIPQEKNVVNVSVDFAENYHRLKESYRIDSDPREKIPTFTMFCEESPMDLSVSKDILRKAMDGVFEDIDVERELDNWMRQDVESDKLSSVLSELDGIPEFTLDDCYDE